MEKKISKGRVVLVTGASGGIGYETALYFAQKGDRVAFHYNKGNHRAMEIVEALKTMDLDIHCYQCDLTLSLEVDLLFDKIENDLGPVEILINGHGYSEQGLFQYISDEAWRKTMSINLDATFYTSRRAVPKMILARRGVILNVSSIWGMVGGAMEVHYSTAKAALIGFTKALAKEVGPSGIRVNCIAPGWIDTPMNDCHDDEAVTDFLMETPLGRLGKTEEIAAWIYFLSSEEASFMTGQVVSPNGGVVI